MKIVNERAVDDSLVIFRLVYISKATFNQDAATENKHPTRVHDGIEKYGEGEGAFFRFIGGDGNPTFVSNWPNSRSARHLFSDGIQIRYQYALKHKDLKAMDGFALDFVKKITRK
ncbi:hypothetical protein [Pseudomonas sp. GL93]|uniref:hypothetical protein n=1 Tax=Pseudomonas sp. GL93 TaxID=2014741 RepID=UPI0010584A2C|nr:hypothetical protein [Pseudomonas sp. GL93]